MDLEIDIKEYKKRYKDFEFLNVYHSIEWLELLTEYYKFSFKILEAQENGIGSTLIPFLVSPNLKGKKNLIFLPFSDQVEILCKGKETFCEIIQHLKDNEVKNYKKIVFHTDVNSLLNDSLRGAFYFDNSYVKHTLSLHHLSEDIGKTFSKNIKRNIKKAQDQNIFVKRSIDTQSLNVFYNLHLQTRKKHGTPTQPFGFFKKMKEKLFDSGMGFILISYKGEIPLAAAVFLYDNSSMIYKYGASNPNLLHLRPNELLFYEAIKIAKEMGLKRFDFGISKNTNLGLRHFKSGFGAIETPVCYSILSNKPIHKKGKTGDNKYLKFIIRHSPLWLNRLIGELFYKYAA